MRFESVLRRGFQVPPRLLLSKVRERLHNALEAPLRRRQDWRRDTYCGVPEGIRIEYLLPPNTLGDLSELHPGLQHFAGQALAGRMNLLGSGWRSAAFKGPEQRQVPPNTRATSERIEGLKNDRCTRIDWHKDLRSGHRYNPLCWYRDVPIGRPVGAEIKTPWELARCHHLPQFACMARFAEEPATWVRAIEDHLLDFWAANPPRWGVNWRCAMDVGIRIANQLLALDLLHASSCEVRKEVEEEAARAAWLHGEYISSHLEWSPSHRGNHYLADLLGLAACGAYLGGHETPRAWLRFAIHELNAEVLRQFLSDGGGFEGSTCYHRLSAELAVWGLALASATTPEQRQALENADPSGLGRRPWTSNPPPTFQASTGAFWPETLQRLHLARKFAEWLTKPDGRVSQIGDNDSGRAIKLDGAYRESGGSYVEYSLNLEGVVDLLGVVVGVPPTTPGGSVLRALLSKDAFGEPNPPEENPPALDPIDPDQFLHAKSRFPRRTYRFELPERCLRNLRFRAFPEFGVCVWKSDSLFVSFRCGKSDLDGRGGHSHNDQLSIELQVEGKDWIADPGSYLYTSDPSARNRYRSCQAHFVPRVGRSEPNPLDLGLFLLPDRCGGRLLGAGASGAVGGHLGFKFPVWRVVKFVGSTLEVTDIAESESAELEELKFMGNCFLSSVPFSSGYGEASKEGSD